MGKKKKKTQHWFQAWPLLANQGKAEFTTHAEAISDKNDNNDNFQN